MRRAFLMFAIFTALCASPAFAVQPDEILPDPALELRARELSKGIRCMVCQNQSIDDSDAPLARDLRILLRERLRAGDSDAQVRDYLVARYGEFVLLEPRKDLRTALLWAMPLLVLLLGGLILLRFFRRQRPAPEAALSPEERRRLGEITEQPSDLTKL